MLPFWAGYEDKNEVSSITRADTIAGPTHAASSVTTDASTPTPLSDIAREVAECYAVLHPAAPARSKAMKWINAARRATGGGKGIVSTEMKQAVDELVDADILEPSHAGERGVIARGPRMRLGAITRFVESAIERTTAQPLLEGFDNENMYPDDHRYRSRWLPAPALPEHLEQHVRLALMNDDFAAYADRDLPSHIWIWLTETDARRYLARLPERARSQACNFGLSWLFHYLQPIDVFAETCEELAPNPTQKLQTAKARVYQGRLDTARTLISNAANDTAIDKFSRIECEALRAVIAMLEGNDATALEAIESAMEIERGGSRKRILYPSCASISIALPALIRLGSAKARSLFDTLLDARRKLKLESELDTWLVAAASADDSHAETPPLFGLGESSVSHALFAIASRWNRRFHYPQDDAVVIDYLENTLLCAEQAGYVWFVAELQSVLEATVAKPDQISTHVRARLGSSTPAERHAALGTVSLMPLVKTIEPWEHALRQLEQLALAARPAKANKATSGGSRAKRIVWQVVDDPYGIEVTPLEQTSQKDGRWTAGRRVALKRLLEQADDIVHLSDQDRKACQTIRKIAPSGWSGGPTRYETDERTLYRLAGHPLVIDADGDPLAVVEEPPEIHVERKEGIARLVLHPGWSGRHYQVGFEPLEQRVTVTHFTASHRRIAEALPSTGLSVPESASTRVDELLGALSADIIVQGDDSSSPETSIAGDPEPLLVLEPSGEGLRVRLRVEPLADTGSYFDAGSGGAVVYVQTPAGSVAVQRDLDGERSRMDALVRRSDVLSARFDGRPQLTLDSAAEALELLDEVQQSGQRCLWPGDVPFRLKARVDLQQVSLQVISAAEWFAADGELAIGDDDSISLARLLQLMRIRPDSRFVELGQGEFLALSSTLKQQLDTFQAFSQPGAKEKDPDRVHPMALLALDPLIDKATLKADASWTRLRKRVTTAITQEPTLPATLTADLRGYQRTGFEWLAIRGQIGAGACLADDMGLGKTVQALALLLSRAEGGPQLVIAPTSVVGNWFAEAQRFAPSLKLHDYGAAGDGREALLAGLGPFDLAVATYGLLVNDVEQLTGTHWHSAVLDEAQAIKNAATRRAKSARALDADCRVVTTGTPVQNNLMDLHSLFAFLNPRLLGSATAFRKRFALPITRDDEHARQQLQSLIAPFVLRRNKRDVLRDLPARTDVTLEVTLSDEEAALYESLRQDALDALETGANSEDGPEKFEVLSHLTRLRRLCCHPSLVAPGWTGPASKLELFTETLNELIASGHKALVFSQFVDNLKLAEQALKSNDIAYQYIDGSISAAQRTRRVDAFQRGEGEAFLISLTAGGTGLNLTAADYVIHLDPWWNPAVEDQASDRAHRIGQQRPVTILRMVTRGTIEQRIQKLHGTKRELADSVLTGTGGSALDLATMLSLLGGRDAGGGGGGGGGGA